MSEMSPNAGNDGTAISVGSHSPETAERCQRISAGAALRKPFVGLLANRQVDERAREGVRAVSALDQSIGADLRH
jgi:hypothetical protein